MTDAAPLSPAEELARIDLFSGMSSSELVQLCTDAYRSSVAANLEVVTPLGTVLIMLSGEVNIFLRDAANKKFLLATATRGDVLGELSYLVPGASNDQKVVVQAVSQLQTLTVNAERFFDIVSSNAPAANKFFKVLAGRLAAMNRFAKQAVDVDIDPSSIEGRSFGERFADWISDYIGTWYFLAISVIFTAVWVILNAGALTFSWDPYPFIFLNLLFSVTSAATLPVLLMSQNRQNQLDRLAARTNHLMTLRAAQLTARALKELRLLRQTLHASIPEEQEGEVDELPE